VHKHPIAHFVYNGSRHSASTVKNLLARLNAVSIEPGTLIWDRGNVSRRYVEMVEDMGWKLICGNKNAEYLDSPIQMLFDTL